jgi:hypothetical protein
MQVYIGRRNVRIVWFVIATGQIDFYSNYCLPSYQPILGWHFSSGWRAKQALKAVELYARNTTGRETTLLYDTSNR